MIDEEHELNKNAILMLIVGLIIGIAIGIIITV